MGLAAAGLSYRLYPTTVLIIPGLTWAILMMLRKNWRGVYSGASVTVVGALGLLATPAGAWLVAGVGRARRCRAARRSTPGTSGHERGVSCLTTRLTR